MDVSLWCEFCVLSGRGLWDGPITRPGNSYRLCCVVLCDLETSRMRRPWSTLGRGSTRSNTGNVRIRNVETLSCNHCSCGKAISIIYSESVFLALGNQHEMRMRHVVICGLSGSTIFFHIISLTIEFFEKIKINKGYWTWFVFRFSLQLLPETFLILRKTERGMIRRTDCTHIVTLRFIGATIVIEENQYLLRILNVSL